jgi:lipopolysaccharide biosynthesis regulator YciM
MRIRTFLIVALSLGVVYATVYVFLANGELVKQELRLWGDTSLSVGKTLVVSFAIGVAFMFVVGASRELGLLFERWRLRKASRKTEEIEEGYSRGLAAVLEGREDEALRHFRAVLERDSRHFNTLIKLGEVLRSQEKYDEAIEYHRKAHHLKVDSTRPLYALVEDHEAKGDIDRARAVLGKIIAINKNSVAPWRKLRSLHLKQQNWEKALEAHERVERLSDARSAQGAADRRFGPGIRYEIASAELAAGKVREAIAGLRRLLKENESFIPAHLKLGEALLQAGQEAEAVQAWYHGFEVTGTPVFLTALEEHYLQREQPLAAIEALKSCISRVRKDTLPRFYLGKLYFRLEMLDDAMAVLSSLTGRANYAPTLHYLLGRIHERRQNHRQATAEYRKVIREMELVHLEYMCRSCRATTMEWHDRCPTCGHWNTVEVNFREELPLEELGLSTAPIYTAPA